MPARFRDLKRALEAMGVTVEQPRSGSHWRTRSADGRSFTIAAHNGLKEEISDVYIRGVCLRLGLDEKTLRSKL